jgi:hypothetical protein
MLSPRPCSTTIRRREVWSAAGTSSVSSMAESKAGAGTGGKLDLAATGVGTDAPEVAVVALADQNVPGVVHRHTSALADFGLWRVEEQPVTAVRVATRAVEEQVNDTGGIQIPKLAAVVSQQQVTASGIDQIPRTPHGPGSADRHRHRRSSPFLRRWFSCPPAHATRCAPRSQTRMLLLVSTHRFPAQNPGGQGARRRRASEHRTCPAQK